MAEVVSKWSGIPVSKLMEGEVAKLIAMEERLHRRVVGQDEAIVAVSKPWAAGLTPLVPQPAAMRPAATATNESARTDIDAPWERTDKAEELRLAVGRPEAVSA